MHKTCLLLSGLFFAVTAVALAQPADTTAVEDPNWTAETDTTLLEENLWVQPTNQSGLGSHLGLTLEQQMQLDELRLQLQDQLDNLSTQVEMGRLTGYRARQAFQTALEEYRRGRRTVLSPEQWDALERLHASFASPLTQAPNLVEALGLSGDQRDQWLQILQRQRLEFRQLKESGESPTLGLARDFALSHRLAFEALLDEEQLEHLRALRRSMTPLEDDFFEEEMFGPDELESGEEPGSDTFEEGLESGEEPGSDTFEEGEPDLDTEALEPDPTEDY